MDGHDGMMMLLRCHSVLVGVGLKVVDERERDNGEDEDGDFRWRGFGLCRPRGERRGD